MRQLLASLLVLVFGFGSVSVAASAVDPSSVPKQKQTEFGLYLTPTEAWEMIQASPDKVLFLDVRSRAEATYVGMPTVADALVPYADHDPFWSWDDETDTYKVEPVQNFVPEANRRLKEKGLTKQDPVIVMCRSGGRSALAANRLKEDGYTQVFNVVEGFEGDTSKKDGPDKGKRIVNGWKNAGLPWTFEFDKSKMYIEQ